MGKNRDLVLILMIVIIGMFIPFLGSIIITFGLDITLICTWTKIASTFGYFLLIFGIELLFVMLYFTFSNKIFGKKLDEIKKK